MKFGKVEDIKRLEKIEFMLPNDTAKNTKLLKDNLVNAPKKEIYVGAPVWSNANWKGKIFSQRAKTNEFVTQYAQNFNTVEVSSFHYSIPSKEQVLKWKDKVAVNPDFKFCPKFHQNISHKYQLKNCHDWVTLFYEHIAEFGENLGMPFLQISPYFGPRQGEVLEAFLEELPKELKIAVELRHPDWFANEKTLEKLVELLKQKQVTLVMTDTAGRRDVLPLRLTTPCAFIRFVANDRHQTDFERMDAWVLQLKKWLDEGLQTVYFFVHSPEELHCPELIRYFIQQFNKETGLGVKEPTFIPQSKQGTLF